ncbi:MAG: hypothetical protein ACJA1C_002379 [Crocinitomicaceae bacterium]|jgi:hypothetical protein
MKITTKPQNLNFRIRVLHAIDYPEIAQDFNNKHLEVLREFGVDKQISSVKNNWWESTYSYIIIAEHIESGELGGGMRLDVLNENQSLPVERVLSTMQPTVVDRLHFHYNELAETCGMWIGKRFRHRNLPKILMRSSICIASKLRLQILIGLANQYTLKMTEDLGFKVVKDVGHNGTFLYPDERYKTSFVELSLKEFTSKTNGEFGLINRLITKPVQKVQCEFKGKVNRIEYDLRIM